MIVPILLVSFILIGIAFWVDENNAAYLLSGYNTMSTDERKNFDIKSYIPFFKKFHFFLGLSLLIIALLLFYFVDSDTSGIFMGTYPLLGYIFFIWNSNKFYKLKTKKQTITTYVAMAIMLLLVLGIVYEFKSSLTNNEIIIGNNQLEITGEYGSFIAINTIKSITIEDNLPLISGKLNGFDLENVRKGYFKTTSGEKLKLLINTQSGPYVLITTKDNSKIFYSSKDQLNQKIFEKLKQSVLKNKL
jgi:hypothetical protein